MPCVHRTLDAGIPSQPSGAIVPPGILLNEWVSCPFGSWLRAKVSHSAKAARRSLRARLCGSAAHHVPESVGNWAYTGMSWISRAKAGFRPRSRRARCRAPPLIVGLRGRRDIGVARRPGGTRNSFNSRGLSILACSTYRLLFNAVSRVPQKRAIIPIWAPCRPNLRLAGEGNPENSRSQRRSLIRGAELSLVDFRCGTMRREIFSAPQAPLLFEDNSCW